MENVYHERATEAVSGAAIQTRQLLDEAAAAVLLLSRAEAVREYTGGNRQDPWLVSEINRLFSSEAANPSFFPYIIPLEGFPILSRSPVPDEYRPDLYSGWGILGELARKRGSASSDASAASGARSLVIRFGQPHPLSGKSVPLAVGAPIYTDGVFSGYAILDIGRQLFTDRIGLAAGTSGALTELLLTDPSGCILYNMSDSQSETTFVDSDLTSGSIFYHSRLQVSGFVEVYGRYPVSAGREYSNRIAAMTFFIALASLIVSLVMAVLLSRSIARPVHQLTLTMEKIEQGQLDASCPELPGKGSGDEIAVLVHRFNRMILRVRELVANLVAQERDLRRAETQALQAQINPHFLYNTLNSIRSMAKLDGSKDIADMTTSLARIMREGSYPGTGFCSVDHSLALARDYFAIEAWRWPGRFRLEESVGAEILGARIPRLIIQPVVENALVHGLEGKTGDGVLSISAHREGGDILMVIADTGTGIETERLTQIRERLREAGERPVESSLNDPVAESEADRNSLVPMRSAGIALINTHRRLCLIYGKRYGLNISSVPGMGTTVIIRFPYAHAEEE